MSKEEKIWKITVRSIVPLGYQAKQFHEDIGFLVQTSSAKDAIGDWKYSAFKALLDRAIKLTDSPEEYSHLFNIDPNTGLDELFLATGQMCSNILAYLTEEEQEKCGTFGFHSRKNAE